jgi:hypothetical protein
MSATFGGPSVASSLQRALIFNAHDPAGSIPAKSKSASQGRARRTSTPVSRKSWLLFPASDDGPATEAARAAALESLRKSGLHMTGRSSAIPDTYEKLRKAVAVARETLKAAATKRFGVAVADIGT